MLKCDHSNEVSEHYFPVVVFVMLYYIDTSVLLENIPLVKFINLHPGPEWFIFHTLTREVIDDVILVISLYYFIDVILSIL